VITIFLCFYYSYRHGNADEIIEKYHEAKSRYEKTQNEFKNCKKNLMVWKDVLFRKITVEILEFIWLSIVSLNDLVVYWLFLFQVYIFCFGVNCLKLQFIFTFGWIKTIWAYMTGGFFLTMWKFYLIYRSKYPEKNVIV